MRIPSEEKYLNDSQFRQLVDTMLMLISQQQTSFSEIREACLFAQLRYEMNRPDTVTFSPQLSAELRYRMARGEE